MASPNNADGPFPLLNVTKALSPFLHSRAEIIDIRRQLTHLVSTITSASTSDKKSLTSQRIEQQLTGVRKRYVTALRENQQAHAEWQRLNDEVDALSSMTGDHLDDPQKHLDQDDDQDDWISSYNQVLDFRRRYESLVILKKCLTQLTDDERTSLKDWNEISMSSTRSLSMQVGGHNQMTNDGEGDVSELVVPLQKAVVKAANELSIERTKLKALQEQHKHDDGNEDQEKSRNITLQALQATKAELESWLEEQLALASDAETPKDNHHNTEHDENDKQEDIDLEERNREMKECYEDYVLTRQDLVTTLQSLTTRLSKDNDTTLSLPNHDKVPTTTDRLNVDPADDSHMMSVLAHLGQLTTIHHRSHNIHNLTSALETAVDKGNATVEATLQRLQSESHMLENFTNTDLVDQWVRTAEEKSEKMKKDVREDVEAANRSIDEAESQRNGLTKLVVGKGVWGKIDGKVGV